MKVLSSASPIYEVISQLEKTGLAPFSDTKTPFIEYVNNKLDQLIDDNIIQGYTNHPTEGYFYFLYDPKKISKKEAIKTILDLA